MSDQTCFLFFAMPAQVCAQPLIRCKGFITIGNVGVKKEKQPGMHPLVGPAAGHTLAHPGAASHTTAARRADLAGRNGFLQKAKRLMRSETDSLKFLAIAEVYPRQMICRQESCMRLPNTVAAGRRNAAPLCSIDCLLLCIDPDKTAPSLLYRRMNGC